MLASADRLVVALAALAHFLVGMHKFAMEIVAALVVLLPLLMPPGIIVQGNVLAPSDGFPTIAENDALRRRSLPVSKSITSFARYPERRPAEVVPAGDGSLDVDQLWVCWGRRCGFSRTQLLQHIADHAISDNGRRRFLLRSDHDGRTWVTVAAPLRRMPRRHRRGTRRRSPLQPGSAVVKPVFRPSHISVSSEDDFVDDADVSADIPGLHEEDPAGASADPRLSKRGSRARMTWNKT